MNIHGVKTDKKEIFFFSFKGDAHESTLDQITLPPAMGMDSMRYRFGEWLKRQGVGWEFAPDTLLYQRAVEFFNLYCDEMPRTLPRRFDRMATKQETPPEWNPIKKAKK